MTRPLQWNETFSIGHRELDEDHRLIIDLINQIYPTCDENQRDRQPNVLLREIESLTERHFEREVAVLGEFYTAAPKVRRHLHEVLAATVIEHAAEHRKRIGDLRNMRRALDADEDTARPKLCEDLQAWFIEHAVSYDAQMKTIIQSV
jgi:hemerythrin-like metal-binding protein